MSGQNENGSAANQYRTSQSLLALAADWRHQAEECRALAKRFGENNQVGGELLRDAAQYEQSADQVESLTPPPWFDNVLNFKGVSDENVSTFSDTSSRDELFRRAGEIADELAKPNNGNQATRLFGRQLQDILTELRLSEHVVENVAATASPPDEDDTPHPDPLMRTLYDLAVVKQLIVDLDDKRTWPAYKRVCRAYEALKLAKRQREASYGEVSRVSAASLEPMRVSVTYIDPPGTLTVRPGEVAQFRFGTGHIRCKFGRRTDGRKAFEFFQAEEAVDKFDAEPTPEERSEMDADDAPRIMMVFEDDAAIFRVIRHLAKMGGMS